MFCLPACLSVHHRHVWGLQREEKGIRSHRTEVRGSCETLYGNWDSNLCPVLPGLLITEQSLHLRKCVLRNVLQ